jgi:hypothetical protein
LGIKKEVTGQLKSTEKQKDNAEKSRKHPTSSNPTSQSHNHKVSPGDDRLAALASGETQFSQALKSIAGIWYDSDPSCMVGQHWIINPCSHFLISLRAITMCHLETELL